jgi:small subunit ribosomal protein S1
LSEIKNTSIIELEDVGDDEMNRLIDKTITEFDEGDLVTGTVVKIEHDEVLLDIGFKSEGVIPARELSIRKDLDPSEIVSTGDRIEALVLQKEDKDGRLILSKRRAEHERAWIDIETKFNSGENVIGEVIEIVKGGLILDIGLRGFLPASLVDLRRVKDLDSFLGEQIEARVIEMDRNRNNVVLSRRVVLEEGRKNERAEILEKLVEGMRLRGTVSSIVDFGAFVDLGGIDGLVHISELSWSHVSHPSEVVKVGDEVEVEILEVVLDRERISLGLKQTTEDPWRQQVKSFPIGSIIEGKVTKLVSFGAFVELGNGIEGLVHISEMATRHIESPSQVVHVGDPVHVKVMEVDPERRRISLSMKSAAETLGIEIEVAEPDPNMTKPKQKSRKEKAAAAEPEAAKDAAASAEDEAAEGEAPAEEAPAVDEAEVEAEAAPAEEAPAVDEAEVEPEAEAEAPEEEVAVAEEAPVAEEPVVEAEEVIVEDAPAAVEEVEVPEVAEEVPAAEEAEAPAAEEPAAEAAEEAPVADEAPDAEEAAVEPAEEEAPAEE